MHIIQNGITQFGPTEMLGSHIANQQPYSKIQIS